MNRIALTLLLTIVFAAPALSQMTDMPMKGHRQGHRDVMQMDHMNRMGHMMGMCIKHAGKMGLTDDQVMKMRPLHSEMQKTQVRFKADRKIAEIELMEVMEVKDFDIEKAGSAVRKIAEMEAAHRLEMLRTIREMRSVLTDEQFGKTKKMMFMMKMGEKKPARKMIKKQ